jgi:hypothetical protein
MTRRRNRKTLGYQKPVSNESRRKEDIRYQEQNIFLQKIALAIGVIGLISPMVSMQFPEWDNSDAPDMADHLVIPSQPQLSDGAIRLAEGGSLFILPIEYPDINDSSDPVDSPKLKALEMAPSYPSVNEHDFIKT